MRVLALALAALVACNYKHVTVPLTTPEARTCADACRARYHDHQRTDVYQRCLLACPGATAGDGKCAAGDQPPAAVCSPDVALSTGGGVLVVVAAVALLALGGVVYALQSGRDTIDPP